MIKVFPRFLALTENIRVRFFAVLGMTHIEGKNIKNRYVQMLVPYIDLF